MTMAAWVVIAMMAAATVASSYSAYRSSREQARQAKFNARVAVQAAENERRRAAYEERRHRERTRKLLAAQEVQYALAGVDTEGSPLMVRAESAAQAEMDAIMIRAGGDWEAARYRSEAMLSGMQARAARRAGALRAGTTLLSGGSQAGQFYVRHS